MRPIDADRLLDRCIFYHLPNGDLAVPIIDVQHAPTVEPERKTGRWIEMSSTNHTYKCSVCGRLLVNITDGKNKVAKNYPYCHCGADMRPTEKNMGKEQRNIRGKRESRNE